MDVAYLKIVLFPNLILHRLSLMFFFFSHHMYTHEYADLQISQINQIRLDSMKNQPHFHVHQMQQNVQTALKNLGLDENIRGEKLSIEMFGKLSEELLK